jgi:nicotinate-nucleotide adenylyltransferase
MFLPAGVPPLKTSDLEEASHRYAMTELATRGNRHFIVSDIETRTTGKSYTAKTLEELRRLYPHDELVFILGVDAFLDIPHWWHPEQLITMTDFIIVTRPGFEVHSLRSSPYVAAEALVPPSRTVSHGGRAGSELTGFAGGSLLLTSGRTAAVVPVSPLDISSTAIRTLVKSGCSIKYLLPDSIEEYVHAHGLYRH